MMLKAPAALQAIQGFAGACSWKPEPLAFQGPIWLPSQEDARSRLLEQVFLLLPAAPRRVGGRRGGAQRRLFLRRTQAGKPAGNFLWRCSGAWGPDPAG